ncbi:hypothetical protein G4888_12055 [Blautia wexlerae]|nr:hypothetical protein [Blautia wexlerae]
MVRPSVFEVDDQLSLFDFFNEAEYLKQDSLKEPEITEVIVLLIIVRKLSANANPICPYFQHAPLDIHFPKKN